MKLDPEIVRWIQRGAAIVMYVLAAVLATKQLMAVEDAARIREAATLLFGNSFLGSGQVDEKKMQKFLEAMQEWSVRNPSSKPPPPQ